MNWLELAKREGELISLPVEKIHVLATAFDYIETYDLYQYISKLHNIGVLAPLTLKDNEFDNNKAEDSYFHNKRYPDIVKTGTGKMLNLNGYNIYIRAKFNHDTKEEEKYEAKTLKSQPKVYISKGGVITGEYFQDCIIRENTIKEGNYSIRTVPVIPVSIITKKDDTYFVVDHREPKIKSIKEMYDVPIYIDEKVQNIHLNLRIYKKLNKK